MRHAGPQRPHRAVLQPDRWPRSRSMLKGERGDLAASLHNLGDRHAPGVGLRHATTARSSARTSPGSTGSPRSWSSSAAALAETLRDAPLALNNLALTYNPQAGTLDTRANLGRASATRSRPTRRRSCAASSTRPTRAARPAARSSRSSARAGPARSARGAGPAYDVRPHGPDPRRTRGGRPMTRSVPSSRLVVALVAAALAADRLLVRRLQAAAARAAPTSGATRSR